MEDLPVACSCRARQALLDHHWPNHAVEHEPWRIESGRKAGTIGFKRLPWSHDRGLHAGRDRQTAVHRDAMEIRAALTAGGAAGWLGGIGFLQLVAWRWRNAGMFCRDILPHGWRVCTLSLSQNPNSDPCGALVTFWSLYTDLSSLSCPLALLSCLRTRGAWLLETNKKLCALSKSQFRISPTL